MVVQIHLTQLKQTLQTTFNSYSQIIDLIQHETGLPACSFYLECNGKIFSENASQIFNENIYCRFRLLGGKGGFGSMLRAIGAQIEKTTNREACRDLSGRRLRDINEEKRVKAWLDKQSEEERQAKDKKKRKIESLLRTPKHEFKDTEYEEARSKLTEKVHDAVEEGFQKSLEVPKTLMPSTSAASSSVPDRKSLKRKANGSEKHLTKKVAKSKKPLNLWIDDNLSDTTSDDSENEIECAESDSKTESSNDSTSQKDVKDCEEPLTNKEKNCEELSL